MAMSRCEAKAAPHGPERHGFGRSRQYYKLFAKPLLQPPSPAIPARHTYVVTLLPSLKPSHLHLHLPRLPVRSNLE